MLFTGKADAGQPLGYLVLAGPYIVSVDGEAFLDVCLRVDLLEVSDYAAQAASFVCGERIDFLAGEVLIAVSDYNQFL